MLVLLPLLAYSPFLTTGFGGSDSLPLIETSRIATLQDAWLPFTRPVMAGTTFASTELMYRPFVSLTFGFDYALWGLNASGFHLTNLVAHLGTMLSVWWLLALLGLRVWSSLAGAAVFGVLGGLGGFNTGSNLLQISFEKYVQDTRGVYALPHLDFRLVCSLASRDLAAIGCEILLVLTITLVRLARRHAVLVAVGALWVVGFGIFCAVLKISTIVFVAYFALLGLALVFAAGLESALTRLSSSATPPGPRDASLVLRSYDTTALDFVCARTAEPPATGRS